MIPSTEDDDSSCVTGKLSCHSSTACLTPLPCAQPRAHGSQSPSPSRQPEDDLEPPPCAQPRPSLNQHIDAETGVNEIHTPPCAQPRPSFKHHDDGNDDEEIRLLRHLWRDGSCEDIEIVKMNLLPRPAVILPNNSMKHKRKLERTVAAIDAAALASKLYSLDTADPGVKTPRTIRCASFKRRKTVHKKSDDNQVFGNASSTSTLVQHVPVTVASSSACVIPVTLSIQEDVDDGASPPQLPPSPEEIF
ncbi:hypothetical protein VNI00_018943 [Paramarasmius palmivorus]|uniref:Uncharacterized protein n=1 Tax=Paramarasmius palmivorus TaxID=297713 RepID=A0AAW0ASS7_9AGAR